MSYTTSLSYLGRLPVTGAAGLPGLVNPAVRFGEASCHDIALPPGTDVLLREIDALRWAVARTLGPLPVAVLGWVVLPDRMMAVWHLQEPLSEDALWDEIQERFVLGLSRVDRDVGGHWLRQSERVQTADDLAVRLRVCRALPVTQGLVTRWQDWPVSSFLRNGGEAARLAD